MHARRHNLSLVSSNLHFSVHKAKPFLFMAQVRELNNSYLKNPTFKKNSPKDYIKLPLLFYILYTGYIFMKVTQGEHYPEILFP